MVWSDWFWQNFKRWVSTNERVELLKQVWWQKIVHCMHVCFSDVIALKVWALRFSLRLLPVGSLRVVCWFVLFLHHFCHPPEVTPDAVCGYLCHWEMRCFFKIFALLFKDTQVMETHPFDALEVFTGPMYIVYLFWPSGSGSFRMGVNVFSVAGRVESWHWQIPTGSALLWYQLPPFTLWSSWRLPFLGLICTIWLCDYDAKLILEVATCY